VPQRRQRNHPGSTNKELEKLFQDMKDMKERNPIKLDAITQGYFQHMIAKVLDAPYLLNKLPKQRYFHNFYNNK